MIHRNLAFTLVAAGGYIVGAYALKRAEHAGLIPPGMAGHAVQVFNGVALAIYANFIPKTLGGYRDPMSAMRNQSVLRVAGWAFTLGGLAFAVTSLPPFPDTVPLAALGAATAYVLGYSAWAYMECSSEAKRSA